MVSILAGSFNMIISDLAETAVARYSTNSAIVQLKSCLIWFIASNELYQFSLYHSAARLSKASVFLNLPSILTLDMTREKLKNQGQAVGVLSHSTGLFNNMQVDW